MVQSRVSGACISGKMGYPAKSAAKQSAKHQSSRCRYPLSIYRCVLCNCYHLTRTPKDVQRAEFYRRLVGEAPRMPVREVGT